MSFRDVRDQLKDVVKSVKTDVAAAIAAPEAIDAFFVKDPKRHIVIAAFKVTSKDTADDGDISFLNEAGGLVDVPFRINQPMAILHDQYIVFPINEDPEWTVDHTNGIDISFVWGYITPEKLNEL